MMDIMQAFTIGVGVVFVYLIYWKLMQPRVPGPFTLPFVGSVCVYSNMHRVPMMMSELGKKYGDTFGGVMPGLGTFVAVLDPKSVEYILKSE